MHTSTCRILKSSKIGLRVEYGPPLLAKTDSNGSKHWKIPVQKKKMFWRVQSYRENSHVNVQYQKLHGALYLMLTVVTAISDCLSGLPSRPSTLLDESPWHK